MALRTVSSFSDSRLAQVQGFCQFGEAETLIRQTGIRRCVKPVDELVAIFGDVSIQGTGSV